VLVLLIPLLLLHLTQDHKDEALNHDWWYQWKYATTQQEDGAEKKLEELGVEKEDGSSLVHLCGAAGAADGGESETSTFVAVIHPVVPFHSSMDDDAKETIVDFGGFHDETNVTVSYIQLIGPPVENPT